MTADPLMRLDGAELKLEPGRHPYEAQEREAIDAFWARRTAANPRLYDGEAVLFGAVAVSGGGLAATGHAIRYAGLIHFLSLEAPAPATTHIYCAAALIGRDGRAVMGRMAHHTVNAGKVYFPSGSLELADFRDGVADLDANMAREAMEETGIALSRAQREAGLLYWRNPRIVALFRVYRFAETAAELAAEIEAHIAAGADDELTGAVVLEPGETRDDMPLSNRAFMTWLAAQGATATIDD